jgi:hypothetical protein
MYPFDRFRAASERSEESLEKKEILHFVQDDIIKTYFIV